MIQQKVLTAGQPTLYFCYKSKPLFNTYIYIFTVKVTIFLFFFYEKLLVIYISISLYISLSVYLSVYLSISLSISLSVYLSIYLSVYLCSASEIKIYLSIINLFHGFPFLDIYYTIIHIYLLIIKQMKCLGKKSTVLCHLIFASNGS